MDLGLRAIAQLRARGIEASLTMIGRGPDEKRWRALAVELGIDDAITWVPWIEQGELMALYASFDALLFPSLHDSSGNVVLEALAQGLPVVCLDLGGPAEMVNEQCGIVVSTQDRTVEQVVESLTNSLYSFARQPAWRTVLRAGARQRVEAFAWHTVVGRVWANDGVGSALVRLTKEEIARKAELDSTAAPFRQPAGSVVSRDNS
jgi:glycosyltransferase involved in cell wall biosynthesis